MNHGRLAVHEGHVKEPAFCWCQHPVVPTGDGFLCQRQRHRIGGKGPRLAPIQVARELVEYDHFRKAACRFGAPMAEFTENRGLVNRPEALANCPVERRIDFPPLRGRDFLKPEVQYGVEIVSLVHGSGSLAD